MLAFPNIPREGGTVPLQDGFGGSMLAEDLRLYLPSVAGIACGQVNSPSTSTPERVRSRFKAEPPTIWMGGGRNSLWLPAGTSAKLSPATGLTPPQSAGTHSPQKTDSQTPRPGAGMQPVILAGVCGRVIEDLGARALLLTT